MGDCSNCTQAKLNEELEKRVAKLEVISEEREKKISKMDKDIAVNATLTAQIFDILTEIKNSIKDISNQLKTEQNKPAKRWDDTVKTVITVAVTYFIAWLTNNKK